MVKIPTITVVIPTLNRPIRTLRAVKSLNDQTFDGIINCVVVDSSNDKKTEDELKNAKFSNNKLNLKYLKNNNSNRPIDNWILGIEEMKTDYGKFLCDDDWLEKDYIEKCLNIFKNESIDCVISNINIIKEKGHNVQNYYKYSSNKVSKDNVIDSFLGINNILPVTPSASLTKTKVLIESFYASLKHIECTKNLFGFDFYMSYYPVFKSNGTYLINEGLANSHAGDDSMTLNVKKAKISYCYFFSLINLIEMKDTKLNRKQLKVIEHKLATFKIKTLIDKEYKMLQITHKFKSKLNLIKLFSSQLKKYYLKVYYLFKK